MIKKLLIIVFVFFCFSFCISVNASTIHKSIDDDNNKVSLEVDNSSSVYERFFVSMEEDESFFGVRNEKVGIGNIFFYIAVLICVVVAIIFIDTVKDD